jgi:hypothetical protein
LRYRVPRAAGALPRALHIVLRFAHFTAQTTHRAAARRMHCCCASRALAALRMRIEIVNQRRKIGGVKRRRDGGVISEIINENCGEKQSRRKISIWHRKSTYENKA